MPRNSSSRMQEYSYKIYTKFFQSDFILIVLQICPRSKAIHVAALLSRTLCPRSFIGLVKLNYKNLNSRYLSVIWPTKESKSQYTLANPIVDDLYGADGELGWGLLCRLWLKSSIDSGWGSLRSHCHLLCPASVGISYPWGKNSKM